MSTGARGRLLLHRYGLPLAGACLLIALVAGFMAVSAYGDVPTETVSEEVDIETFEFESHTAADVDGPNITLYEPGDRLVDMPVYFHDESPTMELLLALDGPDAASFDVRVTAELEATRDDRTFYNESILLHSGSYAAGDEATADIDVPSLMAQTDRINERVTAVGSLEETVIVEVDYESDTYEGSLSASTAIELREQAYWLEEDPADDSRHSDTEFTELEGERDIEPVILFGGLAIVLIAVGGVTANYALREIDIETLETAIARDEFDEWISTGEIPTRASKQYVKVSSLEDVVDIAIDSNKRVIHDPELDAFGVIDADLVYYYSPGADEIEEWLEL